MSKLIKVAKFISRTKDSFIINGDGSIFILYKKDLIKTKHKFTTGGMWAKLEAAWMATRCGIPTIIMKGR